jgi:hypothetical protein
MWHIKMATDHVTIVFPVAILFVYISAGITASHSFKFHKFELQVSTSIFLLDLEHPLMA